MVIPMRKLLLLLSFVALTGCATVPDVVPHSDGAKIFTACKIADGLTTGIAVTSGKFVELNPLLKGIVGGGMSWIPFGIVITAVILLHNWADNNDLIGTKTEVAVNSITCGVAGRNAYLLLLK